MRISIKKMIKDVGLDFFLPAVYKLACNKDIEHKVLFFSRKGEADEISPNFALMIDHVKKTSDFKIEIFNLGYPHCSISQYLYRCYEVTKKIAVSEIVFIDDASEVISCLPLRDETTIVNLWHACGAFKKFGMSTAYAKFGGTREEKLRHPFYDNLSLVSVSSEEVIPHYIEAMALKKKPDIVKSYGVSRTDVFFDKDLIHARDEFVRKRMPDINGRKIILYAPTYRGRATQATIPDKLDLNYLKDKLEHEYVLLIKNHPFVKYKSPELRDFAFDVTNIFEITDLLMAADVCITDYSSLSYEYSLLDRQLIYFCYDIEKYEDWRGFYYDYKSITPGKKCFTTEEVVSAMYTGDSDEEKAQREIFRERFMNACDGKCTDRIWSNIIELHGQKAKNKLNC